MLNSKGVYQRKILHTVIVWVVCAFVGDEVALFTLCRPLSQYWGVPARNSESSHFRAAVRMT